jgi:hypothetical protein
MNKYTIFHINSHTPETDLIGTMVINSYKETHAEQQIIVISHFPDIWLHNPDVFRVYKHGQTPYFYDDFVKEKNSQIFALDPKLTTEQLLKKERLVETWCRMCGIKYNNSLPKIFLTQREKEVSSRLMNMKNPEKPPIFLIEPFVTFKKARAFPFTWPKDIPVNIAQKIVNQMRTDGYHVVQIKNPNQPTLIGADSLNLSLRLTMGFIESADKILCVDSFAQHISPALNKKTVVSWISGHPKNNGYEQNTNYIIKIDTEFKNLIDEYSQTFDFDEKRENQNIKTEHLFDVSEILNLIHE